MKILLATRKHFLTSHQECSGKSPHKTLNLNIMLTIKICSIIMEYADGGDIFTLIKNHQKTQNSIDEDLIWKIFI